jgi:hypothetical protein
MILQPWTLQPWTHYNPGLTTTLDSLQPWTLQPWTHYNPGHHNPGHHNPGHYNPGHSNPGHYNPGFCCRRGRHGESAQHAASCGAGVGVFLLIKSTKILLIRGRRICLYPSVYLDAHGEVGLGNLITQGFEPPLCTPGTHRQTV